MEKFYSVQSETYALLILISATLFVFFWLLDHFTHRKLVDEILGDRELQTHRVLIMTSLLLQVSLALMYWIPVLMLPFFIALFITRTAHEFIDELKWHTARCTMRETTLHMLMWIFMMTNFFSMFIWGFFMQYEGVESLPFIFYIWAGILAVAVAFISSKEWQLKAQE